MVNNGGAITIIIRNMELPTFSLKPISFTSTVSNQKQNIYLRDK